jgi:predicted RNase H-like HicB family nuclease
MREHPLTFTGLVIKENGHFSSLCIELDVASHGKNASEAKSALAEAAALYLETAIENNLPYLRPVPRDEDPRSSSLSNVIETFPLIT